MKKLEKCPLCESEKIFFLIYGKDKLLRIKGEFELDKCYNCGCIFLNPLLKFKELKKYYPKDEYPSLKKIDTNSKKLKIRLLLYNIYFNQEKENKLLKILFSPLNFLISRGINIEKNKRLLDIGAGSGQFLYEMSRFGLDCYGVEPGDFNKESSNENNIHIKNTTLKQAKFSSSYFDIITMNHVLEHLNNPKETLSEVKRILKRDGTFILGVPNTNSLARKIFKKNWIGFDVPRHLINYSNKNLTYLLKKEGFKVIKIRYNSRPSQFVVSLYLALGIKEKNNFLNRIFELIFIPLTWIVNLSKQGDQIEVWCKKLN